MRGVFFLSTSLLFGLMWKYELLGLYLELKVTNCLVSMSCVEDIIMVHRCARRLLFGCVKIVQKSGDMIGRILVDV